METNPEESIMYMEIDTRLAEWCHNPVNLGEVIQAVQQEYEEDYTKAVTYVRGNFGLYKVDADDYTSYMNKGVIIRGKEIPFVPVKRKAKRSSQYVSEKREGILVTIYDAYERVFRHITNDEFNAYFESFEGVEVIKTTQPQSSKDTHVLNNNRFVILKNVDESKPQIDIGSSMQIRGMKFNLRYNGMMKYCFLCKNKHGMECPTQARWEFLKKQRDGKTDKTKIYADSFLRNTNQLALTADVMCMSGGGLGQLCNVIAPDKKYDDMLETMKLRVLNP